MTDREQYTPGPASVAMSRSSTPGAFRRPEPKARRNALLDEAVVLLNDVFQYVDDDVLEVWSTEQRWPIRFRRFTLTEPPASLCNRSHGRTCCANLSTAALSVL